MKILEVATKDTEIPYSEIFGGSRIEPAFMSAFTALNIASALKASCYDVIVTKSTRDAAAAISARQLANLPFMKIVVAVETNSKASKGIAKEISEKVDCWIFPSERLSTSYPSNLRKSIVILPISNSSDLDACQKCNREEISRLAWIGPITGNKERLEKAVKTVANSEKEISLIICGEGNARDAMPAVRLARAIPYPERIIWKGGDFNLLAEIENADAVVQSSLDLTPSETLAASMAQCPIVQPDDINNQISILPNYKEIWREKTYSALESL